MHMLKKAILFSSLVALQIQSTSAPTLHKHSKHWNSCVVGSIADRTLSDLMISDFSGIGQWDLGKDEPPRVK